MRDRAAARNDSILEYPEFAARWIFQLTHFYILFKKRYMQICTAMKNKQRSCADSLAWREVCYANHMCDELVSYRQLE